TAVNLSWAVDRQVKNIVDGKTPEEKVALALRTARLIAQEDEEHCRMIGQHGLNLIQQIARNKAGKPVNVLTHCNAGWLAFVDYGQRRRAFDATWRSRSGDCRNRSHDLHGRCCEQDRDVSEGAGGKG